MGHTSIWGSPARDSQLPAKSTELQGLLKTLLQKSSSNSFPPLNKSAAIPVSWEFDKEFSLTDNVVYFAMICE